MPPFFYEGTWLGGVSWKSQGAHDDDDEEEGKRRKLHSRGERRSAVCCAADIFSSSSPRVRFVFIQLLRKDEISPRHNFQHAGASVGGKLHVVSLSVTRSFCG
jgi:hypothetical protein